MNPESIITLAAAVITAVVAAIPAILTALGVSEIRKANNAARLEKEKQETNEYKLAQKQQKQEELREVIQQEVSSSIGVISEDIKILNQDVSKMSDTVHNLSKTDTIQRKGLQAMLRDRLYQLYSKCASRGYTTSEDRENFENMYDSYHNLGANGVMDITHDRFFELSTEEEFNSKKDTK